MGNANEKNIKIFRVLMVAGAVILSLSLGIYLSSASVGKNRYVITVDIDAEKPTSQVPYLFRTGVFLNSLPVGYPKEIFFKDLKPGMMEFSWDFYPKLLNSSSYDDFFEKLPTSNLTKWVTQTVDSGGDVYIRLMPVPKWLWSRIDGFRRPPKDYEGWAKFVKGLVDYYNNKLQINAKYIVWDEPDRFWKGTKEEYFKLYKHSVKAVKETNRNAMIGGPALSVFEGRIDKRDKNSMLYDFIKYCAGTKLSGFDKLPIDILVWHTFNALPVPEGRYHQEVKQAKNWLREFNYGEHVELNMGSWTFLKPYKSTGSGGRDDDFLASYIASSVIAIADAGFQRHAFFNLFENWIKSGKKTEFTNAMGLLTKNYVVKPAFNAFKLLSMIDGNRLKMKVNDLLLAGYVAGTGDKIYILLSNFIPPKEMSVFSLKKDLKRKGYTKKRLRRYGLTENSFWDILNGKDKIDSYNFPLPVKKVINKTANYVKIAAERQRGPVNIEIRIKGLPFKGHVNYKQYLIDADHSNSYAVRERINKAIVAARKEARQKGKEYISKTLDKQEVEHIFKLIDMKISRRELLKRLPMERRKDILKALNIAKNYFFKKIDGINELPNVKLQKVKEYSIKMSNGFKKTISLEPYAVTLIVLSEKQ